MKIIKIALIVMLVALLSFCKTTSNSNDKPNPPSNPTPADGSTNVAVNTDLEWECTDPEGDPLTYDVYLGIDPNPGAAELVAQNIAATLFDPGALNFVTKYFWKIVADDDSKSTQAGPIWEFTTTGFTEEFNDVAYNFVAEDGRWYTFGGNLVMEGAENDSWASAYYNQQFSDYTFETRVARIESAVTEGYTFGVFFRSNGFMGFDTKSADGYILSIDAWGEYGVWLIEGGVETEIIPWTYTVNLGLGLNAFSKVKIVANGSNFDIYFNDIWTDSFSDATFPTGYITLTTWDSVDGDNEIWWQYYSVAAPEIVKGTSIHHTPVQSDYSSAHSPK